VVDVQSGPAGLRRLEQARQQNKVTDRVSRESDELADGLDGGLARAAQDAR
jgi:hypothetical protein